MNKTKKNAKNVTLLHKLHEISRPLPEKITVQKPGAADRQREFLEQRVK